MPRRTNLAALAVLTLAVAGGCSPATVDVTGRVFYQGRQVTFGAVFLVSGAGPARECILREDGTYLIPKVPIGPAIVATVSPSPAGGPPEVVQAWFPIPERYGRISTSPLRIEVSRETATYDLYLE